MAALFICIVDHSTQLSQTSAFEPFPNLTFLIVYINTITLYILHIKMSSTISLKVIFFCVGPLDQPGKLLFLFHGFCTCTLNVHFLPYCFNISNILVPAEHFLNTTHLSHFDYNIYKYIVSHNTIFY